jgi:Spy/CpxP family protein refolding chaperone
MKKQIIALSLIIGLTMATVASANWGRGGGRGYGGYGGYGDCPQVQGQMMQGPMLQQLDEATQDKIQQFFKDTQPLHKEMAMKRAEKQALMQSDKPDPQAVAKVTGEMFDLRVTIHEKAELAGVDQYVGQGRMGFGGRGPGFGHGKGFGRMMNNVPQQ